MVGTAPPADEQTRAAELIASLCLATDLGMGLPFEHGLRTTLIATRLAERLGVDDDTASQTYYAALLCHAGCMADAHVTAEIFGGSLTTHVHPVVTGPRRAVVTGVLRALPPPGARGASRALEVARRLPRAAREQRPHLRAICEVAEMLAGALALPAPIRRLLAFLTERWDGKGPLGRAGGEEIPRAVRIVHVAREAALQRHIGGPERAVDLVREHAGRGLDPEVAACVAGEAESVLGAPAAESVWAEVLAREPGPPLVLEAGEIDRGVAAIGDFADLVSPYLSGHSGGVARLAAAAAERCGLGTGGASVVRRAGFVHDVGRVAVDPAIWGRPGPLSPHDWEQVRLHAYHTERVITRATSLSGLASVAGAHHERLDGSGYHRAATGGELTLPARLLATADAYHAMTEPRPHRAAMPADRAAEALGDEARAGRLDADAVGAVLEAAGQPVPHLERPAGLTAREAEVVGMLARGLQTKQIARALGISTKTADHHIQHAYRKAGVSSRAAATLFAMQHGLVAWGELPIGRRPGAT